MVRAGDRKERGAVVGCKVTTAFDTSPAPGNRGVMRGAWHALTTGYLATRLIREGRWAHVEDCLDVFHFEEEKAVMKMVAPNRRFRCPCGALHYKINTDLP